MSSENETIIGVLHHQIKLLLDEINMVRKEKILRHMEVIRLRDENARLRAIIANTIAEKKQ